GGRAARDGLALAERQRAPGAVVGEVARLLAHRGVGIVGIEERGEPLPIGLLAAGPRRVATAREVRAAEQALEGEVLRLARLVAQRLAGGGERRVGEETAERVEGGGSALVPLLGAGAENLEGR